MHHAIPIIELWGRLLVPLQGDLTDTQMDELQERVLDRIRERGATGLVVDASGIWMMDSHLCAVLARLAASARLMGSRAVLCGLGPAMVMTLQAMGVELSNVETAISLEFALRELGVVVEVTDEERALSIEAALAEEGT